MQASCRRCERQSHGDMPVRAKPGTSTATGKALPGKAPRAPWCKQLVGKSAVQEGPPNPCKPPCTASLALMLPMPTPNGCRAGAGTRGCNLPACSCHAAHRDCMHTSGTSCSRPPGPWGGLVYKEEEVRWRRESGGNLCSGPNSAHSLAKTMGWCGSISTQKGSWWKTKSVCFGLSFPSK